ncbi:MAG: hypothetical protein D8H99_30885 [Streptococcus sp.]|nr:MAG: hypothetical protein D8H99_30885 [Streptococcus sp.]
MSNYYTEKVKTYFTAYINNIEFTQQDEYYAVKRFLNQLSFIIDEIKSENPELKFDKFSLNLISQFKDAIFDAAEYGASYYQISDFISVERNYETEDLTDIYITYMGRKDTYFKEMNEMFKENAF